MKVQEIGLSTEEKKSSQITLTSKLIARAIPVTDPDQG